MVRDRLEEIYQKLKTDDTLSKICIKSFKRPETLSDSEPSIVLIPISAPLQTNFGSDSSFSKVFIYQINVESKKRTECKEWQRRVEKIMEAEGFYQIEGSLDDYLPEIKRYVDARTYRGTSTIYDDY